ncbi:unnamed protein product [Ambrosiozyma monospora]|uniref:P-type Cu(+) transporter n=1 Tax=Ambrosiozyma monospora TaxID=43982 RepID=A0A9W6Z4M1_AMBMO|nr:unnamed protein product [Ambrosiozyma monospora]
MTCASCSGSIEQQVNGLPGIKSCYVALTTEEARIEYDANTVGIRDIISCIDACGFEATMMNKLDHTTQMELLAKTKEVQYWRSNFIRLLYFGLPIVFFGHVLPVIAAFYNWETYHIKLFYGTYLDIWIQAIAATYVQFVLGKRYYSSSFKALMHGSGTMDLLITVSTSIVYAYSCFSMLVSLVSLEGYPPRVLFSTSAMLFIFVSLGKWAESRAKGNTSTALSKLLSLAPTSCVIVENPSYVESVLAEKELLDPSLIQQKQIPVELLQKNDIVIIQSGSKIPSDGICIYGSSEVDESLLTGESLPVPKSAGSKLIGGSLNTHSTLYMKVQLIGSRTQLQQIVQLVRDAQISKAPVQRYADAIAAKFVPTILILSFATLLFWSLLLWVMNVKYIPPFFLNKEGDEVEVSKILQVAISVIVVACPCALGLAAPTAVMVGTGVGASNGILIKGGEVLERASDIDCIVFDKTGTITAGKMKLVGHRFVQADNVDDLTLWSMLHAIECNSEHPVGQAIAKGALYNVKRIGKSIQSIKVQEVKNHVGYGISAEVIDERDGFMKTVKIGTAKFIKDESKLTNFSTFQDIVSSYDTDTIASVSHISIDDTYFGYIQLADSLRQDSRKTIEYLKNQGYLVALVTGDNTKTSNYVAKLADYKAKE